MTVETVDLPGDDVATLKAIKAPKPPYRVPTMAEIRATEPNGFTVASTFSGCGGSSLGYRMAGFKVKYANEFVEEARETYRANAADYTYLDDRDIRRVTGKQILDLAGGEVDLLDGSPPCSAFSTAGKREAGWGKVKAYSDDKQQIVDDLFFEFARVLKDVQPKMFVAENVSGLVKGTAKGYFKLILQALRDCGYRVEAKLLNAAWLGVPQARQRLIFIGVRNDLGFTPRYPKPLPYQYTIREAIGLPEDAKVIYDTRGQFSIAETTNRPASTITTMSAHHNFVFSPDDIEIDPETGYNLIFKTYSIYETWRKLKPGQDSHSIGQDLHFSLKRVDPGKPAPTMQASHGNVSVASPVHWAVPRKFTLGECRRLCAFPDDFQLTGNYGQRWERMGRAVPPVMMAAVASACRDNLLEHL